MTLRSKSLLLYLLALPVLFLLGGCGSLQSITITPVAGFVVLNAVGQTAQFTALGGNQMGSASPTISNITNTVTWTVANSAVASISATGLATALGNGRTQVMAESGGKTATSDLTVNIPAQTTGPSGGSAVASITIIPGAQSVSSPGQTSQFIAIGTSSTGVTVNLTTQVAWSSSSAQIATVGATTGLATAVGQGVATVTAIYTNPTSGAVMTGTATFSVAGGTSEKFTTVTITPGSQSVSAPGLTSQFIAIGAMSTGTTVDLTSQVAWSSSSAQIASVDATTGLATAVSQGTATVTALYTNPSDGTVVRGIATFTVVGGITDKFTALTIIPGAQSVSSPGKTSQFLAIGASSTGATVNLTSQVAWSSSSAQIATIGASTGLATAVGQGVATVTAIYTNATGGAVVTGTASLTVVGGTMEKFTAVTIIPGSPSVSAPGQMIQFLAIGTTSTGATEDLSNQVAWSSSSLQTATVGATTGLATAVGQGVATVTALYTNATDTTVVTGVATLTVTGGTAEKFTAVTITPSAQSVSGPGQTSQFIAIGVMGSGATVDLSNQVAWSSSSAQIATVGAMNGLATAVGQGTATMTALYTNPDGTVVRGTATFAVAGGTTEKFTALSIVPGSQSVASPGQTSQFIAIGTMLTGATVNLSNQVAWTSSSAQIAAVDPASGVATAVSQGVATVTAIYTNAADGTVVTGVATITVAGGTAQQFTSMILLPGSQSLSASGQTGQFMALGTSGSTGLQQDVTNSSQIVWSSSIPTVATVSASGQVTAASAGTTSISAVLTVGGSVISATANVVVSITSSPEPLLSLTVIPSSITVGNLQDTGQFLAIGTFSTVPYVRDLTNSPTLTWISSVPSVFPVDTNTAGNPGATAGIASAYGNGSAVIIAEARSVDGTIQTATSTFNCPLVLPNPNGNPPTAGSCFPGSQAPALLSTITVYNEGLNTSGWLVTAPSATGTPDVIHCGPGSTSGGSVCVATYPFYPGGGPTILVTAPAEPGVAFAGWSYNCTPSDSSGNKLSPVVITADGPNYCTVTFAPAVYDSTGKIVIVPANTNVTLGAIFN